jgi:hypothetical protein
MKEQQEGNKRCRRVCCQQKQLLRSNSKQKVLGGRTCLEDILMDKNKKGALRLHKDGAGDISKHVPPTMKTPRPACQGTNSSSGLGSNVGHHLFLLKGGIEDGNRQTLGKEVKEQSEIASLFHSQQLLQIPALSVHSHQSIDR